MLLKETHTKMSSVVSSSNLSSKTPSKQIDKFVYALNRPPLHLEPFQTQDEKPTESVSVSDYIATSATRDFFRMIEVHRNQKKLHLINQNKVLPSGQVVGEFCVCYIQTLHHRRQTKNSNPSKKRKRKQKEKTENQEDQEEDEDDEEEHPPRKKRKSEPL